MNIFFKEMLSGLTSLKKGRSRKKMLKGGGRLEISSKNRNQTPEGVHTSTKVFLSTCTTNNADKHTVKTLEIAKWESL